MKKLIQFTAIAAAAILVSSCAGTGKFYKLELKAGDTLTGHLMSNVKLKTGRGAVVDIPANNIEKIEFGMLGGAEVTLRDGNELEGRIITKTIKFKLTATGKIEEIAVNKIKRFESD